MPKETSPYLDNPNRLADVIAAIQAIATCNLSKIGISYIQIGIYKGRCGIHLRRA